jgi:hypothetical protein
MSIVDVLKNPAFNCRIIVYPNLLNLSLVYKMHLSMNHEHIKILDAKVFPKHVVKLHDTPRVMDRTVKIVDAALAYSPDLAFLSFGGRWRGSSGSYRNNWGFDGAGAGLRLRAAIRSWISLCDGVSSCGLFGRAILSVAAPVVGLVVLAGFGIRLAVDFAFVTIRLPKNRFIVLARGEVGISLRVCARFLDTSGRACEAR